MIRYNDSILDIYQAFGGYLIYHRFKGMVYEI
jgi:hypothetical protein